MLFRSPSGGKRGGLIDNWQNCSRDQIPILVQVKRDDRLHVEDVNRRSLLPLLKLKLLSNGTLIRSDTGFCVFLASSVALSSSRAEAIEATDRIVRIAATTPNVLALVFS